MYRYQYHTKFLSVMMCIALVAAQTIVLAERCAAVPPHTGTNPSASNEVLARHYVSTTHAKTVKGLWGLEDPALLEIGNDDSNWIHPVSVWTMDPHEATAPEAPETFGEFELYSELFLESDTEMLLTETEPPYVVLITTELFLKSGFLSGTSESVVPMVGVQQTKTVEYVNSEMDPVTMNSMVVAETFDSIDEAEAVMADAAEAEPDDGKFISCVSEWVGDDGYQCCSIVGAWRAKVKSCYYIWLAAISGCVISTGAATGGCIGLCLKFLTPNPLSIKACLIGCGLIGIGTLVLCIHGATMLRGACEADAWAWYCEKLGDTGCASSVPFGMPSCGGS